MAKRSSHREPRGGGGAHSQKCLLVSSSGWERNGLGNTLDVESLGKKSSCSGPSRVQYSPETPEGGEGCLGSRATAISLSKAASGGESPSDAREAWGCGRGGFAGWAFVGGGSALAR